MDKSYLSEWLSEFPDLTYLLNEEDKKILSTIDPRQYADFNLTQVSEVVRIINEHKPQAWKWEKLFPGLRDLSPEDHVILDHIVPNEYLTEITEQDIRRIIEYRKSELRRTREESESFRSKQYYQDHKTEIEQEEVLRSHMVNVVKYTSLLGISFITASIVLRSMTHACLGVGLIAIPLLTAAIKLKKLDSNTVIPHSNRKTESKMDLLSAAFIALYYIGFIGMGITLGMLLVWEHAGWDTAVPVMVTGLSTIGISVMLFLILAITIPPRE